MQRRGGNGGGGVCGSEGGGVGVVEVWVEVVVVVVEVWVVVYPPRQTRKPKVTDQPYVIRVMRVGSISVGTVTLVVWLRADESFSEITEQRMK